MDPNIASEKMRLCCETAAVTEVTEVAEVLGVDVDKGLIRGHVHLAQDIPQLVVLILENLPVFSLGLGKTEL